MKICTNATPEKLFNSSAHECKSAIWKMNEENGILKK
jgi:hypothetical protein